MPFVVTEEEDNYEIVFSSTQDNILKSRQEESSLISRNNVEINNNWTNRTYFLHGATNNSTDTALSNLRNKNVVFQTRKNICYYFSLCFKTHKKSSYGTTSALNIDPLLHEFIVKSCSKENNFELELVLLNERQFALVQIY